MVYLMLRAQHEKLKKEVGHDLTVANYVLEGAGGFSPFAGSRPLDGDESVLGRIVRH